MTLANSHTLMLNLTTATVACLNHQRQRSRRDRSIHGLLMLALYLPLVLMIAIGPLIANTDHFHQTISHGPVCQAHHHLDVIAQADALELGTHHVHLSDSLQLNALVAGDCPTHPHTNRDLKITNPLINYADVFPDGLLRPPRV
jgi:hypothetical protein